MAQFEGGVTRHPVAGTEIINLSDKQMGEIADLISKGMGRRGAPPQHAAHALSRWTRNHAAEQKAAEYQYLRSVLSDLVRGKGSKRNVARVLAAQKWYSDLANNRTKGVVTHGNLHHDQLLTQLSVAYANPEHIWSMLCAVVPVQKKTDKIPNWSKRSVLQAPDDELGPGGDANEVEWDIDNVLFETKGRGLKSKSYGEDVANADAPYDVLATDQDVVLQQLDLKKEQRVRDLVTTSGNYATDNTNTLTAANRWDTPTGGNPIKNMQDASAALWEGVGPTRKVMGSSLDVYHVLSRHPQILGLFQYNGSSPGLATPDMIAQWLRADQYVIGEGREATGNEAQAASYSRIWPNVWFLLRVPVGAATQKNAFFCAIMRWMMTGVTGMGTPINGVTTTQWFDATKGTAGIFYNKVSMNEVEIVVANDTGYLWRNVIG